MVGAENLGPELVGSEQRPAQKASQLVRLCLSKQVSPRQGGVAHFCIFSVLFQMGRKLSWFEFSIDNIIFKKFLDIFSLYSNF